MYGVGASAGVVGRCGGGSSSARPLRAAWRADRAITSSTTVYDLERAESYRSAPGRPLTIPPGAVVVPGSRQASGRFADEHGIHLYAPIIVKYRDASTDAATALEEALR